MLAGTLLKGGKQDRQVGQDFIVPPGKTVPVEAFCVEHGRWTAERAGRSTGGKFEAKRALASKAVRGSAQFKGNQQDVWDEVAKANRNAGQAPQSGTFMATLEDGDAASKARRGTVTSTLTAHFAALQAGAKAPSGLAYAIDGKVREVRAFSHPALFARLSDTLLSTVALEADLATQAAAAGRAGPPRAAEAKDVVELVRGASAVAADRQSTKAGNRVDVRKGKAVWAAETYEDAARPMPATKTFMNAE